MRPISETVPVQLLRPDDWNRQWLNDLRQWDRAAYFYSHHELVKVSDLRGVQHRDMWGTKACSSMSPLHLWVDGDDIVDKKVLEIGCGPGLLGKQLSLYASHYVGIDQSPLAIDIARGVSPSNCSYYYVADDKILEHAGTVDTVVSRDFFVHQSIENARWALDLARTLLKDEGVVWAEFLHNFSGDNLKELAESTGFRVAFSDLKLNLRRKFVKLTAVRPSPLGRS